MAKDDKKPISDVAKPGSVAPDSSAKPIIVSHKPIIKDPMVQDESKDSEIEKKEELKSAPSDSGKVIEPLSSVDTTKQEKKEDLPKEPAESEPKPSESDDNAVVDAVLSQADQKNKKTKEDAELAERETTNNKLIDSKKYFVKIKQPKRKRNKRLLLLVMFIFVFGIVGVGVAADADLLPINVPFNFISSDSEADTSDSAGSSVVPTETQPTNDGVSKDSYVVPEGYKEYKNEDAGVSFVYPEQWGDIKTNTDPNEPVDERKKLSVRTDTYEDETKELTGLLSLEVYNDEYLTVLKKYGPLISLKDGKWIVVDPNIESSTENSIYKEGDVVDVPVATKKDNINIYDFSYGDEGCMAVRYIAKNSKGYIVMSLPSVCGQELQSASSDNIASYNTVKSEILKSIKISE